MSHFISCDSRNARRHDDRNQTAIQNSLRDLGAGRSIIMDSEDVIIGGNGVFQQAQKLHMPVRIIESDGSELIAIRRTDLKTADAKRKALALADNRCSDLSTFDDAKVAEIFVELENFANASGFSEDEIEQLTRDLSADDVEEPHDPESGDVPFSEELLESHNYIVLYFTNDVDWLQAQTLFQIHTVQEQSSKPGYNRFGVGRVINGAQALNAILAVKDKDDKINTEEDCSR